MTAPPGLHTLARLHGVQTAYHDHAGRRVSARPESLMAALRAMNVELETEAVIPQRVAHRRRSLWERAVDPVVVVWTPTDQGLEGRAPGSFRLRTRARLRDRPIEVMVGLEGGGERRASVDGSRPETLRSEQVGGTSYVEREVPLPVLPTGYHELIIEVGTGRDARRYEAVLIVAPERAAGWEALPSDESGMAGDAARHWGLFAPLYSLHERTADAPPATPTYPLLSRFAERAADAGASAIGTLPLLAAFLDQPYEPSPYSPVSRLFWNELYVAPADGEEAGPGDERFMDPREAMRRRRPLLEEEARRFFGDDPASSDGDRPELAAFRARNPLADDYARFRALTEVRGPWDRWPDRLRARDVRSGDYDSDIARYHLYVQWRAERQLAEVAERGVDRGVSLYLDLPLGVHPAGYDVWRERSLFATSATAGAPPDPLATGGQDWGFPPLHPEASRLQGHRYFVASIRKHLRFARVLRIDHVMQLHRMFWIPHGDASQGVYVRYPADELYAILCLESHRAGAVIVGEDLGTVPRAVRRDMRKRGLPGMYVLEFELEEDSGGDAEVDAGSDAEADVPPGLRPKSVGQGALASIGTHDTPTFAGWWWGGEADAGRAVLREKLVRGLDRLGLLEVDFDLDVDVDSEVELEGAEGRRVALAVEEALLRWMGGAGAGLVLATMEDLWLEREPQNVPGTLSDRNWRRRARHPLEVLSDPAVAGLLRALHESRKGSG